MDDKEILSFLEKQDLAEIEKSNPFLVQASKVIAKKMEKQKN